VTGAHPSRPNPAVDLDRSYQLSYFLRGPEWAIAVPQGDLDVLEDVMRRCSTFWNGVGTLLIPVRRDGRIPRSIDVLLTTRPVERFLVHRSLSSTAREAVAARFGETEEFWERYDEREMHPLVLVDVPEGPKPPLNVPQFGQRTMCLAALACWGALQDNDLPYWHERFDVAFLEGDAARRAIVDGQTAIGSTSPLRLTANHMRLVFARNMGDWHTLVVLHDASFEQLLWFWNFRSRSLSAWGRPPVVGIPRGLLRSPDCLASLKGWLAEPPGSARIPNVFVNAVGTDFDATRQALSTIGFEEDKSQKSSVRRGRDVKQGETLTFWFARRHIGERIVRGSSEGTLLALRNPLQLDLPAPPGLARSSGHHVRLTLHNLPVPLPLTKTAARRMHSAGEASDGLTIGFHASPRYQFSIRFPDRAEALADWATDMGYIATPTQDSRYADALLARLQDPSELDALADGVAVGLLRQLAPQSRQKLAQRLRKEFEATGAVMDEDAITERLRDLGLFLEIEARDANALAGLVNVRKEEVLAALEPLVASGFVVRGHVVACPVCNVNDFHRLDELAERLSCRACRASFLLPVSDASGASEPQVHYRLDGLMARAMDQDVLPVLLALRTMRRRLESPHGVTTWHGVVLDSGVERVDVDLLAYNGDSLVCCECKDNGSTLTDRQVKRLVAVASACEARPALACLRGSFKTEQTQMVEQHLGFVLQPHDLLS
jgi:hypothetical protein